MRLLTWNEKDQIVLTDYLEDDVPPYAILSHTWGPSSDEVTFEDVQNGQGQNKAGYVKIRFCGEQARRDKLDYFWVDTCCIRKTSDAELSQAIRSMFRWYNNAEKCYAYLADVSAHPNEHDGCTQRKREASFRNSKWFTRGWTLQELLAPTIVQFFSQEQILLGDKRSLMNLVHEITTIPVMALEGVSLDQFSIAERVRWTNKRQTKLPEDRAYCLLGIFRVHMPLMYGEGEDEAIHRLRMEINQRWGGTVASSLRFDHPISPPSQDLESPLWHEPNGPIQSLDNSHKPTRRPGLAETRPAKRVRLSADLNDSNLDGTNLQINSTRDILSTNNKADGIRYSGQDASQSSARAAENDTLLASLLFDRIDFRVNNVKRPLSSTCQWLFCHPNFQTWYGGNCDEQHNGFLWIKGKPGCGKSTLMKAALEWTRKEQKKKRSQTSVVPYFFNARSSTSLEKSRMGLYRTVVHHLVSSYPNFLRMFLTQFGSKSPESEGDHWTVEELEGFLEDVIDSNEGFELYLFIDALDEAEYDDDVRRMISFLTQVSDRTMVQENCCRLRICLSSRHYPYIKIGRGLSLTVEAEPEHGQDISKYVLQELTCDDGPEKDDLRASILAKSARIFLWVVLVVRILNKLDDCGASLSEMKAHLKSIPEDLNQLFVDILTKNDHGIETSMLLFQWMAFRMRPLGPAELFVAMECSKSPMDDTWTLSTDISIPSHDRLSRFILDCSRGLVEIANATTSEQPVVQFIHETVREFLLKEDGLARIVPALATNLPGISHEILRVACLRRLNMTTIPEEYRHPRRESLKTNTAWEAFMSDMRLRFSFLDYAVLHIFDHAEQAQISGIPQQLFLESQIAVNGVWEETHRLWWNVFQRYKNKVIKVDISLSYMLAKSHCWTLLSLSVDILDAANAVRRDSGNIFCAASAGGRHDIVQMMLDRGFNINQVGEHRRTALHTAAEEGITSLVQLLLDRGADITAESKYGTALHIAVKKAHKDIVQLLLERGGNINTSGEHHGSSLHVAIDRGHVDIVRLLLESNVSGRVVNNALHMALDRGYLDIVRLLLKGAANANAHGGEYDTALQAASIDGNRDIVQMLLDEGADVNAQGGYYGNALQAASVYSHQDVVQMLLDKGADVNVQGGHYGNALQAASVYGNRNVVQMLLDKGADVNAQEGYYGNALQAASASRDGYKDVVQMLLNKGADVNAQGGLYGNALNAALAWGHVEIAQILRDSGARTST